MMPATLPEKTVNVEGMEAHFPALDVATQFDVRTSLVCDTPDQRMKVLEILDGDALPFESCVGAEIELCDFICHPVKLTNRETGEEFDAIRTILIASDGQCISTCSPYVLQSMGRIGWANGSVPPWDPGIRVKLVQQSTRDKRRVFKLRAVKG